MAYARKPKTADRRSHPVYSKFIMKSDPIKVPTSLANDATAGVVVFLVALPLCLGIALASGAPLFSGIIAGIVGGIIVGAISGSHTSIGGPAAGLTAIVSAQISQLGAFETFLLAVMIAGVLQIALGLLKAGALSAFFPSSVIKGLLAAIGIILILKQIPHILGHDSDPEGEMGFTQPDHENTFSEIGRLFLGEVHFGALIIGLLSILLLLFWESKTWLKKGPIPAPLVIVLLGIGLGEVFRRMGAPLLIERNHLVQVPIAEHWSDYWGFLVFPNLSQWNNLSVYYTGSIIAMVASLETLLNLEAIDKIDPYQRRSPSNRELIAQGVGNIVCGAVGGIPVTSVIVRSSVNINAGGRSKRVAIFHGCLLWLSVVLLPAYLNLIPLSSLAAILMVTGFKLASPDLIKKMFREGRYQFVPFVVTLVAIVLTDLMIGIGIGMAISVAFILNSNMRRPLRSILEKHSGGEVVHIQLANQVSFLNRASLEDSLYHSQPGTHLLLDAELTDYIDPDLLSLIREFKEKTAAIRGVTVSTKGFRPRFNIPDDIRFIDFTTEQIQNRSTPIEVLETLREGNRRFLSGNRLVRDLGRQLSATSTGQHPLAVILTCIDSRSPAELIFDTGLGDIFTIRIAGNVVRSKVLGSMEYACAVAGAKLILVMGHTKCGAVNASVELTCSGKSIEEATGCQHLGHIVDEIAKSIDPKAYHKISSMTPGERSAFSDAVARKNVLHAVNLIPQSSTTIQKLIEQNRIAIVGAMYDVTSGSIEFLPETTQFEAN